MSKLFFDGIAVLRAEDSILVEDISSTGEHYYNKIDYEIRKIIDGLPKVRNWNGIEMFIDFSNGLSSDDFYILLDPVIYDYLEDNDGYTTEALDFIEDLRKEIKKWKSGVDYE